MFIITIGQMMDNSFRESFIKGSLRGATAPLFISSPSPLKERGIKGVRLINKLNNSKIKL